MHSDNHSNLQKKIEQEIKRLTSCEGTEGGGHEAI